VEVNRIVFSNHALQEMTRRNILRAVVEEILNSPEQIVPGKENRTIYQSRLDNEEGGVYLIRVIVDIDRDPPLVITVYRTSKVQKYWREG
jgi:Domain of unknown function (DUF4258)